MWSTRWYCATPVRWSDAQDLRRLARQSDGSSLGDIFHDQLHRQYQRVRDRVPELVGTAQRVQLGHYVDTDDEIWMDAECFVARLPSGHLLACVDVVHDGDLRELPSLLVDALRQGPGLCIRRGEDRETLEHCLNHTIEWTRKLREQATDEFDWSDGLELKVTSEMHSMIITAADDTDLFPASGERDEHLIGRLVGRLDNDAGVVRDRTVLWPNEFNKLDRTVGAIRPGASLIAGMDDSGVANALVSTLLLMGAASLLREVRDEVHSVQESATAQIQADVRFDWRGRGPLADEITRLAHVQIAVALDVESHLDIRRMISDAKLVQWHSCLAEALAIPQSVTALHEMALHLGAAMQTVSQRSTARNAFIISALAAAFAALAVLVTVLISA
jgi:hypothetical protein